MNRAPGTAGTGRLWPARTVWAAIGVGGLGAVAMVVAWSRTATTIRVERQVDWVPLGVAGASAVTLAMVLWILAGRRAVAVRVAQLAALVAPAAASSANNALSGPRPGEGPLLATDSMVRFHRPSCPLLAGKRAGVQTRSAHEAVGRRPCGMCEP